MTDESKRLLYYTLPVFLVVLGSKLLFIQLFGSNLPFWDQWDAEGAGLFKPYLEGTLGPEHLFASHNEHRILFTRLLELAMLEGAPEAIRLSVGIEHIEDILADLDQALAAT